MSSTASGGKIEVTYLPSGKTARVPAGTTLFNAAHWAGLPIESTCGGRGTCGKCGVQVLEGEAELSLADYRHLADKLNDGWRLSCQCPINGPMTVDVPRLMKMPKAATMGVGRFVLLEPNVVKLYLELPPPSLEDHRSHLRRVMDAVEDAGYTRNHDWEVLPKVAEAFRNGSNVTATLVGEYLVDCEEGDTRERMFGASFDIGTTTCVCT
ncbi:MAG TPA: 2Fe-2S iron-sulfur cluster-binding protein, partial [Actinomycetota bacterium]|nr:2Fe-2S iron-sulfur cluster-binding protein [Actinomycetota bacterium]